MNIDKVKKNIKQHMEIAKKMLLTDKHAENICFAVNDKNEAYFFPLIWENEKDKEIILFNLRLIFFSLDIQYYIMVTEAWFMDMKKKDKNLEIRHHFKDRKECLLTIYVNRKNNYAIQTPFERKNGEIILGEFVDIGKNNIGGRLTNLLKINSSIDKYLLKDAKNLFRDFIKNIIENDISDLNPNIPQKIKNLRLIEDDE